MFLLLLLLAIVNGGDLQRRLDEVKQNFEQAQTITKFEEAKSRSELESKIKKRIELRAQVSLAESKFYKAKVLGKEKEMKINGKEWSKAIDDLLMESDDEDYPEDSP